MNMNETFSFDEALHYLGTTRPTLYRWLHEGKISASKVGRQWRFSREGLAQFRAGGVERERLDKQLRALSEFLESRKPQTKEKRAMQKIPIGSTVDNVAEQILWDAHDRGASDIHLQPQRDGVRLSYRINQELDEIQLIEPKAAAALTKAWEEKGVPFGSGGERRLLLKRSEDKGETEIQVACQSLETLQGKRTLLRIFRTGAIFDLQRHCADSEDRATFERWLASPHGLVIISGPTASGKAITMMSLLQHSARKHSQVVFTLESSTEVMLDGVNQVFVDVAQRGAVTNTFQQVMRQDPDIIGINIENDADAARAAIFAARTGHLALITLTSATLNDAVTKFEALAQESVQDVIVGCSWQKIVEKHGARSKIYEFSEGNAAR
jgi:type IV pilus assembly protein PilB